MIGTEIECGNVNAEMRAIAERCVNDRIGFYIHFTAYVSVNAGLFLTWFYTGQGLPWFIFPLVFWGIGILAHAIAVFASQGYYDRKVEEEYQRLKDRRQS